MDLQYMYEQYNNNSSNSMRIEFIKKKLIFLINFLRSSLLCNYDLDIIKPKNYLK